MSKKQLPISKKRHAGERLDDFKERRRACNQRRRQRERFRRLGSHQAA